jgi:cob(I)alamin adenosyltransferase
MFLSDLSPSDGDLGIVVLCAAVLTGLVATLISIAGYFATRREVDDLQDRVSKLEQDLDRKTARIHKRVNRLLAGQMLIAGQVGVALDRQGERLAVLMKQLEAEED